MNVGSRAKVWTTRHLLAWTTQYFTRHGLDRPRLAAEFLLAHTLGQTRLRLYMDCDRPSNDLERANFHRLIERAVKHEPIDYLIGHTPFWSMTLKVDRRVLVPRPSTETVVEHVVHHARVTPGLHTPVIADIGTGSGAIAVAVAKELPQCRVIATDISNEALEVAHQNATLQDVADRVELRQGDLLEPLVGQRVHFLISNPPYISDAEWQDVPASVRDYEPMQALRGGRDGLDYIRRLIDAAPCVVHCPGQLVLEIAASQEQSVLDLVKKSKPICRPQILCDHEGLPRVLVADRD